MRVLPLLIIGAVSGCSRQEAAPEPSVEPPAVVPVAPPAERVLQVPAAPPGYETRIDLQVDCGGAQVSGPAADLDGALRGTCRSVPRFGRVPQTGWVVLLEEGAAGRGRCASATCPGPLVAVGETDAPLPDGVAVTWTRTIDHVDAGPLDGATPLVVPTPARGSVSSVTLRAATHCQDPPTRPARPGVPAFVDGTIQGAVGTCRVRPGRDDPAGDLWAWELDSLSGSEIGCSTANCASPTVAFGPADIDVPAGVRMVMVDRAGGAPRLAADPSSAPLDVVLQPPPQLVDQ